MKILEFAQSLGLAEILITIFLIAITAYGIFDARKVDKEHEADEARFNKKYSNHGKNRR